MLKKKKISKYLIAITLIILGLIIKTNISYGTFEVSDSRISMDINENKTITISGKDEKGSLSVASSDREVVEATNSNNLIDNNSSTVTLNSKKKGTATITITAVLDGKDGEGDTTITKDIKVSVGGAKSTKSETQSGSTNLTGISLGMGTLTPKFNKNTTEYSTSIETDLTTLTVTPKAEDETAMVAVTGNTNLKVGSNTVKIVVTSNEESKTYTINVTKTEANETETKSTIKKLGLKSLNIEGVELFPTFNESTYTYKAEIKNKNITSLDDIQAEANESGASVEIVGNDNLQDGDNTITIIVTSKDGKEIRVYQIFVTKNAEKVSNITQSSNTNNTVNNNMLYIILGIVVIMVVVIVIIVVQKNKKSKKRVKETVPTKKKIEIIIEDEKEVKANVNKDKNNVDKTKKSKSKPKQNSNSNQNKPKGRHSV